LTDSAAERRMAVRLSQRRLRLLDGEPNTPTGVADAGQVSALPSVRRLAAVGVTPTRSADGPSPARMVRPAPTQVAELGGDDDEDADLDDTERDARDEFYADVMDSG